MRGGGCVGGCRQIRWNFGSRQGVQGLHPFGEVLDKMSIDVTHTQEAFQLCLDCEELCILQSTYVFVAHVELPRADYNSKVLDLLGQPRAHSQVQGNYSLAESVQDLADVLDKLLRIFGEYDDIVRVNKANQPLQAKYNSIQSSLEGCRCICQPRWHRLSVVYTTMRRERRLLLIFCAQWHLPISRCAVERSEHFGVSKESWQSSIRGQGYVSFLVMLFSRL